MAGSGGDEAALSKSLKLFDVYAMATGAMFSSGLFLLPGIAAATTGTSVYLAYFAAGFLILPAMYCMAELSTAMPKSGGTYFFLDRAMGPLMGAIGGLGSWVAVVFKSAFALVGMGAYLGLYLDVPITLTAVVLTLVFGAINYAGAKETTMLQRILVTTLVVILGAFVILGFAEVGVPDAFTPGPEYGAFFNDGLVGFISTIGLVFVSYAGLTKVASVAEEIENPDRNVPLGMTLALLTATAIYTLGTLLLVKLLTPEELFGSLTPMADGAAAFLGWVPFDLGVILIVVAAIAAFASTGNAGIMSASRYPFAMAKDKLLPEKLATLSRFETPSLAIAVTVGAMVAVLVLFDVASVAKLASAFQLLLFGLVCLAVIVMRESGISSYKPGFRTPFYPWVPVGGILIAFWLIVEMGYLPIGFTGLIVIGSALWYQFYAADQVKRRGAIFHMHEQLGKSRYEGIEHELMSIVHARTAEANLTYEAAIARSAMIDLDSGHFDLEILLERAVGEGEERFGIDADALRGDLETNPYERHRVLAKVMLMHRSVPEISEPCMFVFRLREEAQISFGSKHDLHTVVILLVPEEPVGLDLRIAGHLAEIARSPDFEERWLSAKDEAAMNALLVRDDHFLHGYPADFPALADASGKPLSEIPLPESCLIVMVERGGELIIARDDLKLRANDLLSIIGEPAAIRQLATGQMAKA
ncbi:amino acid permease [Aurantiacibacter sediminis]|uniref:Amino acid permease n=1 Tax=Aurantiacibacter sediminis TaxID=2793064 RepID=A0ABS0MZP3_9SPHN|nr:amino acid permease [Aurantiacibacter sediminis]MBH5321181.1 amino acid permease [Aurantiacibacter sediminis]